MVIAAPMPSMPVRFWNDPDGSRYHDAYFDTFPGIWRHGDWMTVTTNGTYIVHGRSDSTINRGGVRMGSADIYAGHRLPPRDRRQPGHRRRTAQTVTTTCRCSSS